MINTVAVALKILLIDVDPCDRSKESFKLGHAKNLCEGFRRVTRSTGDHGSLSHIHNGAAGRPHRGAAGEQLIG
jgi:hypothetical protein